MNVIEKTAIKIKTRVIHGWNYTREKIKSNEGMGTVEIILIIVVLIGLVIIFKDQISGLVEQVFESINSKSTEVTS